MLLHPAVDQAVFEQAVIQGHILSFATINLSASSHEIREELRRVLASSGTMKPAHRPALAGLGDHL
jgi:hypothetical protein